MITTEATELTKVLSGSVAPVFLVTGIAGIIATMSQRYGRVIDRIRTLLRDGPRLYLRQVGHDHLDKELKTLYKRAKLLRITIAIEITSVLFIVLTICSLFLSLAFDLDFNILPSVFFIASLLFLLLGLLLFIKDFWFSLLSIENDMSVRGNIDVHQSDLSSNQRP